MKDWSKQDRGKARRNIIETLTIVRWRLNELKSLSPADLAEINHAEIRENRDGIAKKLMELEILPEEIGLKE